MPNVLPTVKLTINIFHNKIFLDIFRVYDKEFWKSVNILWSYGQQYSNIIFDS